MDKLIDFLGEKQAKFYRVLEKTIGLVQSLGWQFYLNFHVAVTPEAAAGQSNQRPCQEMGESSKASRLCL